MKTGKIAAKINLQHRLFLTSVGIVLVTLLLARWNVWMALGIGVGLSFLASRRVAHRVRYILAFTQAWLRGSLSLRIADPAKDEIGLLADQLDFLAQHLEEDEQDLEALREHNARLSDQVRALAVVEERNRLARELHDSVKQHLFSLAMTASAIRARCETRRELPAELHEMLHEVELAAQTAQRETTRLIEDLRPGTLAEQGLVKALNDYTLLLGAQEHLLVYLDAQGNDRRLPLSVTEALYRIAQEALHNVARHAHASRVDVTLRILPERVNLSIADNGAGFDMSTARTGLGMTNMQERLMNVGGKLTVTSELGAGTQLTAEVNLHTAPCVESEELHPNLAIDNWAWLGQRLVIPVGQTWPWHPAEQTHLRRPLVDPDDTPLRVQGSRGLFRHSFTLLPAAATLPLARFDQTAAGYEWNINNEAWQLQRIRGRAGCLVLKRKGQALAALQYQGRQMHTWTEINYDEHGYRLARERDDAHAFILEDETGDILLRAEANSELQLTLYRPTPLPLLIAVTARILDELSVARAKTAIA